MRFIQKYRLCQQTMGDGHVFQLVEEVLKPVQTALDTLFYAGVLYGATGFSIFLKKVANGIRTYFIPFGSYKRSDLSKRFGKWAVITCGTSEIGMAYAHEFARRGMNIVLISSSYDQLVSTVSELLTEHNVTVYGIHANYSLGPTVFQEIHDILHDFEVGILVNNQAACYEHPQYFALVPHRCMWELMDVNVVAPTVMTHMLLPQMVERGRGAIINVCSAAALTPPTPLLTAYTATSAYLNNFSRALKYENQHKGIVVQTLLPCEVSRSSWSTLFTPSPSTYVRHALSTFGVASHTAGYWPHALQRWFWSLIPRWLWVRAVLLDNTKTRREVKQARERNHEHQFTRRRHYIPQNFERARYNSTESRVPNLSLRRTPSPQRRISTIEPPGSPKRIKRFSTASAPSLESQDHLSNSDVATPTSTRPLSAGHHPTIWENPITSTPLEGATATAAAGGNPILPSPGASVTPGGLFNGSSIRRVSNSSIAGGGSLLPEHSPTMGRRSSVVKMSRVLVIPSVARVSHHPNRSRPGSPHPQTEPPLPLAEVPDTM